MLVPVQIMTIGSQYLLHRVSRLLPIRKFFRSPSHFLGAQDKICHNQFRGWRGGGVWSELWTFSREVWSGKAIQHETLTWSNIKKPVDIKRLAEWPGHDCKRILFMEREIDNWCVHASTGTKIYICWALCFWVLQLYLIQHTQRKCNPSLGEGVEFGLTETCFPSLGSEQKHKLKIGSQ